MGFNSIYQVLDNPIIYRLVQNIFAPGGINDLREKTRSVLRNISNLNNILDVGCGPYPLFQDEELKTVGLDICFSYTLKYNKYQDRVINANAGSLPFRDKTFDCVLSINNFHHLPDDTLIEVISECIRVTKSGGYFIVIDPVLPKSILKSPLSWLIRKLDRGRYMRKQGQIELLLSDKNKWSIERFSLSYIGLEAVICMFIKHT